MSEICRLRLPVLLCIAALGSSASRPPRIPFSSKQVNLGQGPASRSSTEAFRKLPLQFEPNVGQADPSVQYLSRGRGYTLLFGDTGATLLLRGKEKQHPVRIMTVGGRRRLQSQGAERQP